MQEFRFFLQKLQKLFGGKVVFEKSQPVHFLVTEQKWIVFGKLTWLQFILWVITVSMLGMSFWHGISGDDIVMNEYGNAIYRYFTSFGKDDYVFTNLNGADRDEVISYYGGFFSLVCVCISKILPFNVYTITHFCIAVSGAVATYFAAKISDKYIGQGAAIVTAVVMFLNPFWLGNAMNNPKDTPFAAAYIMSVFFILRFLERLPKLKKTDYLWVVLSIALSINIRVAGILMIPYFALLLGVYNLYVRFFYKQQINIFQHFEKVIFIGIASYFGASLFWPWALQNPVINPYKALVALSNFQVNLTQLWHGNKMMSSILPSGFLPYSFLLTNPFFVLVGFLVGILFLGLLKNKKEITFVVIAFILFTIFFPVAYILYKKSNVYHLWRHVLFIYPSMAIIIGFGFHQLANFFEDKSVKGLIIGVVAFLMAEPLMFIVKTFPNIICYYNNLIGGTKGAYGLYEVDFYYNSLKESADWLQKNVVQKIPAGDSIVLATNASHILIEYFKNEPKVKVNYVRFYERNEAFFDYSLFHIALLPEEIIQTGSWLKGNVIYNSTVLGKSMNCIFKKTSNSDAEGMALFNAGKFEEGLPKLLKAYKEDASNELVAFALIDYYNAKEKQDSVNIFTSKLNELKSQNQN